LSYYFSRVESLLEERKTFAHSLHDVYLFTSDYIRLFSTPDIFQVTFCLLRARMYVDLNLRC
jgi:hypothetical protein